MIKKKIKKKNNIINFPTNLSSIEKEIEAIIFGAPEPLTIDTIESKISKKNNLPLGFFISRSDTTKPNIHN